MKMSWTLIWKAGFEISSWAIVWKTGSPVSHRKTCQDLMEGLGANGVGVKWIFNKQDARVMDYIHVAKDRNKL